MKRRKFLAACGSGIALSVSGCLNGGSENENRTPNGTDGNGGQNDEMIPRGTPKVLEYTREELQSEQIGGGPGKDGIPSIDNPSFAGPDGYESSTFTDDIVFGVDINGVQKAYPRIILAHHEIVNDSIGDENVSVTYCPLTGTAIGFKRGGTTFGVSGDLINNNLVMYDRQTDSRWPQMLGTAISGPQKGKFLEEFRVVWTSWDQWVDRYPDTRVLTTDTGYIRDYSEGPYGTYQPRTRYYRLNSNPLFNSLKTDDSFPNKSEFIGARTKSKSYAVRKNLLRDEKIVTFNDNTRVVYDPSLDTGYVYPRVDENLSWSNGSVEISGEQYEPQSLPSDKINAYDAMWFAWNGYYPSSKIRPET